ncbi:MAG TPA: CPBP family intramembrane glutamic endopeptidase, partial [Anaerolineaceae bacterium]|nr:CPBP family intramembrane glutamic endopeptidase [Anaerolineaceae bacterium]
RELLTRLFRRRIQAGWYVMALLLVPLVTFTTSILLAWSLRSPEFLPVIFTTADPMGLLLPGIIGGLLVGVCEEIGWTGFAIPRLRMRYSVLAAGLLMGVLWGAWHAPLFAREDSFTGAVPLALLLLQLFSWLPAYRVLMVWVHDRTESLLVTMLMHVSLSATTIILPPPAVSDVKAFISIFVSAVTWWLIVAVVVAARRKQTKGMAVGPIR